jgi:hypothetical protein
VTDIAHVRIDIIHRGLMIGGMIASEKKQDENDSGYSFIFT